MRRAGERGSHMANPLQWQRIKDAKARGAKIVVLDPLRTQARLRERTDHHSRFREQAWAKKVSPDPLLSIHPQTAEQLGVRDGDWVAERTRGHAGRCRLKAKLSEATAQDTVVTGMGWWRPDGEGPEYGALDVNINAAMSYAGPYDPVSGSADTRGIPCPIERIT